MEEIQKKLNNLGFKPIDYKTFKRGNEILIICWPCCFIKYKKELGGTSNMVRLSRGGMTRKIEEVNNFINQKLT